MEKFELYKDNIERNFNVKSLMILFRNLRSHDDIVVFEPL